MIAKKNRAVLILQFLLFISCGISLAQTSSKRDSLFSLVRSASDTTKAKLYNTIVRDLFMPNFPDSMIFYAKKGAQVKVSNKAWNANLINTIGVSFYYKSEYDSALYYYLEALKIRETIGNEKQIISSLNNIAVIYQIKGDLENALKYYFRVLRFREKAKDEYGISNICENIGNLYLERSDTKQALHYQLRALNIRQSLNDTLGVAQINLNLANTYDIIDNRSDSVFFYISSSIPVLLKYNQLNYLGQAYNALGIYYSRKNNPQLALNYFVKSKDYYQKMNDVVSVKGELVNIGLAKFDLKDISGALKDCEDAVGLLEEVNHQEKLKYCYGCLFKSLKALNKHKEALVYHEKLTALRDTMNSRERIKELTKIEMNNEYTIKTELAELKHEKDIEIREQEKRSQRLIIYFIVFALIAAVFFAFFIVNRLNITKKQNKIIEQQKHDVELQKEIIEDKQKEIIDSINYAKRIQNAILAHRDFINENIPTNFVLFKPKDIVSGDFFWATRHEDLFYLAICDSTGHGVPGAFMSLLNIGFLSEAINEKNIKEPNKIFNYVRQRLIDGISKEGQKDGFDGILLCIDQKTKKITYSAANNAPIIIRNGEIIELAKDKMPVGIGELTNSFTLFDIEPQKDDSLYLYTDGYADQFGGPKGKKFLYKKMNQLISSLSVLPFNEQKEKLEHAFEEWKGALEQVDDVLVIAIKI